MCHRTQVAIRGLLLENKDFERFVSGKEVSDRHDKAQADEFITSKILLVYKCEAVQALKALENFNDEALQPQRQILMKRWTQISDLVQKAEANSIDPKIVEHVESLQ